MRLVYCDESGYEGEKLIDSTKPLFAHASVLMSDAGAAALIAELRARVRSPASSYRAGHLLREKHRATLAWFLSPEGPVAGRGSVFLLDKAHWVATRTASLLDIPVETLDRSPYVLAAANDMLRGKDQPGVVDEFFRVSGLTEGRERAELFREWLATDRVANSVLDPLVPALVSAVRHWGPATVVHDRQIMLPERRIELIREQVDGLLTGLRFGAVESCPQIQVADMLAGTVRALTERPDDELFPLAARFVAPGSFRS
ncbi:DUF3800 domain-containing protein [Actinoplanes sp. NBRC 103695]|uniref:DUF3800 domain-containing protein n=1 Tax=Actinoplanes sp. NBRC 103695 TaxID=3032202 RepID=UPI0024A2AF10|nr:DUF3800 domain-containing protein [Actinoplanes sp. NBRC 103695]GLY95821.1 hypothetical protein Acsp02_30760 [Actinoplanes sp. NBRC 103695]